jgi:hypothetical protein
MAYNSDVKMTPYHRDRMILDLRRRGLSYRKIGKVVHMSANGVMHRLRAIQDGRTGTGRCRLNA